MFSFAKSRSNHPEVFVGKGVLKMCSKFTGEYPCQSVISIKLQSNHISAWVFYCKFATYFQNTFSYEHLWVAASVNLLTMEIKDWRSLKNAGLTNKQARAEHLVNEN